MLPLEYQMATKTYLKSIYLPTYVTIVTVVTVVTLVIVVKVVKEVSLVSKKLFSPNNFFHLKTVFIKKTFFRRKKPLPKKSKCAKNPNTINLTKLKNSQCNKSQKLQKLQNSVCDKTQQLKTVLREKIIVCLKS